MRNVLGKIIEFSALAVAVILAVAAELLTYLAPFLFLALALGLAVRVFLWVTGL